eukprot:gnl/Chilomastix_cuspidata/413.p1 GENE.gnl/Chilomastix_cuspidata/413~~gnl/Chilomastix_cuspidata/413.p1  ORF type:complete len:498 (-),score=228.95 gnl/Chilomastix_cuspidata/413:683-1966(-)
MSIPDVTGNVDSSGVSIQYSLSNIIFKQFEFDELFCTLVGGEGVSCGVDDAQISVSFDWEYTLLSYPYGGTEGSGQVGLLDTYISIVVSLSVNGDAEQIEIPSVSCDIGDFQLVLDGESTGTLNLIIELLSPVIQGFLEDMIASFFQADIVDMVNAILGEQTATQIDEHVSFDGHTLCSPEVTDLYMTTRNTGRYFLTDDPDTHLDVAVPALPDTVSSADSQGAVAYTVWDTLWWAYLRLDYFHVDGSDLSFSAGGANYSVTLTAAALEGFIPDILSYVAADEPVEYTLWCGEVRSTDPLFTGIYVGLGCEYTLATEAGLGLFAFEGTVGLAEQAAERTSDYSIGLQFFFHNATVDAAQAAFSAVAADDVEALVELLTVGALVPFLNDWGMRVAFPFLSFPNVDLTDPQMTYEATYLSVVSDIQAKQ